MASGIARPCRGGGEAGAGRGGQSTKTGPMKTALEGVIFSTDCKKQHLRIRWNGYGIGQKRSKPRRLRHGDG